MNDTPRRMGCSSLTLRMLMAFAAAFAVGSAQAQPTVSWRYATGGEADGVATGDVDADGRREVAVIINGSSFNIAFGSDPYGQPGSVLLLDSDGRRRWSVQTGRNLHGIPAVADIDRDGADEIVVCETAAAADCVALDGDGRVLWRRGPYYYPSLWTMGPSIADVDQDGDFDVVFSTWGGMVVALDGQTGTPVWSFDAWTRYGELFYSHVALGQLDADRALEVVVFGYRLGLVLIIDGGSGTVQAASASLFNRDGNYAFGTGPTIADIDGNGTREIVTTAFGRQSAVYAIAPSGAVRWRHAVTQPVYWTSAAVGDSNADGTTEIYVQGMTGTLEIVSPTGTAIGAHPSGSGSWFEPFVLGAAGGGLPAIVYSGFGSLEVARGTSAPFLSLQDAAAYYWRGTGADLDRDGLLDVVVTDPVQNAVIALDLPVPTSCTPCSGGTCSPVCPAGATCNFCGGASTSTNADCAASSTCGLWCTQAQSCDLDCEGARCQSFCLDPDSSCTGDCTLGADCSLDCDGTGKDCEIHDCVDSTCDLGCNDTGEDCEVQRCQGASCAISCTGPSRDCEIHDCRDATCAVACDGAVAHDCTIGQCNNSSCSVSCEGNVDDCELTCGAGSQCVMTCGPDVDRCRLSCSGQERVVDCGGGVLVCSGTPCP